MFVVFCLSLCSERKVSMFLIFFEPLRLGMSGAVTIFKNTLIREVFQFILQGSELFGVRPRVLANTCCSSVHVTTESTTECFASLL